MAAPIARDRALTFKEVCVLTPCLTVVYTSMAAILAFNAYDRIGGCAWSGFSEEESVSCCFSWSTKFVPYIASGSFLCSVYICARLRMPT